MKGLADAAVCRSESDWLVGINGTRAMTAFNSKTGGFHLTTVGRVQTPTLALMVEREDKIRKFKARPYWELEGCFTCTAGTYKGKWFDEKFAKGKTEEDEHQRAERLWDGLGELFGGCLFAPGFGRCLGFGRFDGRLDGYLGGGPARLRRGGLFGRCLARWREGFRMRSNYVYAKTVTASNRSAWTVTR